MNHRYISHMQRLSFKHWILSEFANYGFGTSATNKVKGGTEVMQGDGLFAKLNSSLIITELCKLPPLGNVEAVQIWDDSIQWGSEPGALQIAITPLGSMKVVSRRLMSDLKGEQVWVLKQVFPFRDFENQNKEIEIAHKVYKSLTETNHENLEAPDGNFEDLHRLATKLWNATKRNHPSYIMFPVNLQKYNENYYKMIFEFRGQGAGSPYNGKTGRTERFDIDLVYYKSKGLLRCLGYDIDSSMTKREWRIQTPEWDELFTPKQDFDEICECVIKLFMQY